MLRSSPPARTAFRAADTFRLHYCALNPGIKTEKLIDQLLSPGLQLISVSHSSHTVLQHYGFVKKKINPPLLVLSTYPLFQLG